MQSQKSKWVKGRKCAGKRPQEQKTLKEINQGIAPNGWRVKAVPGQTGITFEPEEKLINNKLAS